MDQRWRWRWLAGFSVLWLAGLAGAQALNAPTGAPVLLISGKIGLRNSPAGAQFDMAMLEKLPQQSFTTATPWEDQQVKFSGPLLRDVLAAVKATGGQMRAVAVNDYKVAIPLDDVRSLAVVLALRVNDRPIPPRTKGPLWVIYPFNNDKALLAKKEFSDRSIWQVKAIEVD